MTRVIGLTGGIGSGKSTVAQYLAGLGAAVIDADKLGHEAYLPHTETWRQLVKTFGPGILAADETVDRKKLGALVFGNTQQLEKLNAIVFPRITEMIRQRIEDFRKRGTRVIILDAPVMLEAGEGSLADEIWVVISDEANAVRRVTSRTGLPETQIRARIRAQLSNAERVKRARVVISNDGTMEDLRQKLKELWEQIKV